MNDPDNFLGRWSRRKRDVAARGEREAEANAAPDSGEGQKPRPGEADRAAAAPAFDIERLPPIESIEAGTDISDFLRPGVPDALRHAALRRAWSADPVIRDFVGINENYWDAAGPGGIPGFGPLDPGFDVERVVSELFGERPTGPTEPSAPDSEEKRAVAPFAEGGISRADAARDESRPTAAPAVQGGVAAAPGSENVAMRIKFEGEPGSDEEAGNVPPSPTRRRRHGGAMPQ